jgi:hypothetical protein
MRFQAPLRLAVLAALTIFLPACGEDPPTSFSDDAVTLPATILEMYPLAARLAGDWNENAFPSRLGGGFTVLDADGRGRNHSFEFHARFGTQTRRLTVHFFNGVPWLQDTPAGSPPVPFTGVDFLDSDATVGVCRDLADALNDVAPGSIPAASAYAARLISANVYPEPRNASDTPTERAWRVDFLEEAPRDPSPGGDPTPVWWSLARFYIGLEDGQFLGDPVLPATDTGRELYPFP